MELVFHGADGLPEHGLLALHAGTARFQARLSSLDDRSWKFPCRLDECGFIKVEVFESVGRGRFFCEPAERSYSVALDLNTENGAAGSRRMEVRFTTRPADGDAAGNGLDLGATRSTSSDASPSASARRHRVAVSAHQYLDQHDLVNYFQDLLQQLIREKPAEPYKFLAAKLTGDPARSLSEVKALPAHADQEEVKEKQSLALQLQKLIEEHPYLEPSSTEDAEVCHPLHGEVTACREAIAGGQDESAAAHLKSISDGINRLTEAKPKAVDPVGEDKVLVVLPASASQSAVLTQLNELIQENPYLEPGSATHSHTLHYWVRKCRDCLASKDGEKEAASHLGRIVVGLEADKKQIADAFKRFDADGSEKLDVSECKHMCSYLGWGAEAVKELDENQDGTLTLPEFQSFVGRMGGVQTLFKLRRARVAISRRDVMSVVGAAITVGSRVRAHFYLEGKKSKHWQEAVVLEVGVKGIPDSSDLGIMLEFGIGCGSSTVRWKARQVIPPTWVISGVDDAWVATAMREVGILDDQQAFWASIFPESEMRAVGRLVGCQRQALSHIRTMATASHEKALPEVRERFINLGFGEYELQAVLSWIQDLAPVVVHVHIDNIGRFLETDNFYRNQFETHTSCGALDDGNTTRIGWERELFGDAYEEAKPFDRCKYGALSVMNDFRGVTSASQYGDSYMVLKDVRLRCTFAATDSGGIAGSRLAVLDKYAHVLQEYNDRELKGIIAVATSEDQSTPPQLLRGQSQDPTKEWATLGFPSLKQQQGCFFFEVELQEDCAAPQVGLASPEFVLSPGVASTSGVGDDEHSWAVDGQNAARWHKGQPEAWSTTWPTKGEGQGLAQTVIVGIAVDLDAREVWISTDGVWEQNPAFGPSEIPEASSLYPAVSLQGRAAFNFGPDFRYARPDTKAFELWPGTPGGRTRVDCPRVGNSDILDIYKEAQIHGEVNLQQHVQRLVANDKYRKLSKTQRSSAMRFCNAGPHDGTYRRVGAHAGAPYYKSSSGGIIFWEPESKHWCLNGYGEDFTSWQFSAPASPFGGVEPPSSGWSVPHEQKGIISLAMLKVAFGECGLAAGDLENALAPVLNKDKDLVYKFTGESSFAAEFAKFSSSSDYDAEAVWSKAIAAAQRKYLKDEGFANATVVQTEHPYPASSHSWKRTVRLEGAGSLAVHFSDNSVTYDSCAKLTIVPARTVRDLAGKGARVQVNDMHAGTVASKDTKGVFKVKLDRVEGHSVLAREGDMFAMCPDEPATIRVHYEEGIQVGSEVSEFILDQEYPLTPIRIGALTGEGSAMMAGVEAGWFLDLQATIFGPSMSDIAALKGEGFGEPPEDMEDVMEDLEALLKRLNEGVKGMDNVTLVFTNGLRSTLLPFAAVTYSSEQKLGDEVASFRADDYGNIQVDSFKVDSGPAQAAGVRSGWKLDLEQTLQKNPGKAPDTCEDMILCTLPECSVLGEPDDVTLVFARKEDASTSAEGPVSRYATDWSMATILGNSAEFTFETDGDGSSYPERRWGFFALVVPGDGADAPSAEKVKEVVQGWQKITTEAQGLKANPTIERVGWDETRLRALCKRHGWDFEWMTEDGERRRRLCERQGRLHAPVSERRTRPDPDGYTLLPERS